MPSDTACLDMHWLFSILSSTCVPSNSACHAGTFKYQFGLFLIVETGLEYNKQQQQPLCKECQCKSIGISHYPMTCVLSHDLHMGGVVQRQCRWMCWSLVYHIIVCEMPILGHQQCIFMMMTFWVVGQGNYGTKHKVPIRWGITVIASVNINILTADSLSPPGFLSA